jgi:cytochrome bd-type quinol oxidase subunit 1
MIHGTFGKKATCLTIIITMILIAACVLISGCSYTQESAYIDKMNPIVDRYNNIGEQYKQLGTQFNNEMNTALSNPDAASTLSAMNQVFDKYLPQLQQLQAQLQQVRADLNALQPPPRFANNHARYLQGTDTAIRSITDLTNGANMARNPNTADASMAALQNAMNLGNEADTIMSEAHKGVSVIRWPLIIGIIASALVVAVALGYWSGRIARNKGHGFWGFFFVGFFLGLIGVLITWLVTKGGRKRQAAQPVYLGQIPPADYPGQIAPPGYPESQAPPPAGPKTRARAVAPGKTLPCRYCGAQVPITKPKCPACGRMMAGL